MLKKSLLTLIMAAIISSAGLTGCGISGGDIDKIINEEIDWAAMAGDVSFPSEYMISYDVALEDGSIITIFKRKDAAGNVYYQNGDVEAVIAFISEMITECYKDPEKNLPKLLDWFDMFDIKGTLQKERTAVRSILSVNSGEYFDYMIELGAKFAWFFTYMPVGKGAVGNCRAA